MTKRESAKNYLEKRDYKMEIIQDDGVHRHLKFMHDNSHNGYFNITTWPGYLCISGDMGTYVFCRIKDMVEFFAGEGINPGYWHEKVESESRFGGGCEEFEFEVFKTVILEKLNDIASDDDYGKETREEAREAIRSLNYVEPDRYGAIEFMRNLEIDDVDVWDWGFPGEEFTFHYLFACYAINFACNTYLASKSEAKAA